jgi:hypothetical protein
MEELASAQPIGPDERAFRADLEGARFQEGVDRGRWRLVSLQWPVAVIAISSAPREGAPDEFFLRFNLEGYPQGVTAGLWDPENERTLPAAERPKGERLDRAVIVDWQQGDVLYVPWDRLAFDGHPAWPTKFPGELWDPREGIVCYLRHTHDLLNDEEYVGV